MFGIQGIPMLKQPAAGHSKAPFQFQGPAFLIHFVTNISKKVWVTQIFQLFRIIEENNSEIKKKLGFHAVVLVKTFPLMYHLPM